MRFLSTPTLVAFFTTTLLGQKAPDLPTGADRNDWQAYHEAGMALIVRRADKAEKYFEYAALLEPTVAEPLMARYAAWWRHNPQIWELYFVRGDKLARSDKGVRRALTWRDQALLINPFVSQSFIVYTYPSSYTHPRTDELARGRYDFYEGRYQSAVRELTGWLDKHPDYWWTLEMRGIANVHLRRWGDAERDFHELIDSIRAIRESHTLASDIRIPEIYHVLGLMHLLAGNKSKAKEAFHHSFEEDLAFYMGHMHYGSLLLEEGDTVQALAEYAQAVDLAPKSEVLRYNYGTALLAAGQPADAVPQFQEAIKLNPLYAAPYFNCALAYERIGTTENATKMYRAYLERAPLRQEQQITLAKQRTGGP